MASAEQSCNTKFSSGDSAGAIAAASVGLSNAQRGAHQYTRFALFLCRANALKSLDKIEQAQLDYREALRLAEKQLGPFDPELVKPLTELGRIRSSLDDQEEAELLLLRAKDITHRNSGIFNVEQDDLLEDLTSMYMSQGRKMKAKMQQELALRAAEESFGEDSPNIVPALHEYANWAAEAGNFPAVRKSIERAIHIQEQAFGPNHLGLIETLRLRARLFSLHPTTKTPQTGERALSRVADIYAAQEHVDQIDLMKARTDLGDWYMRSDKRYMDKWHRLKQRHQGKALHFYQQAVTKAREDGIDPRIINQFFGAPKLIRHEASRTSFYGREIDRSLRDGGRIVIEFQVSSKGRTRNWQIIEDTVNNPDVTKAVIFRVETSLFRPRFIDGKPVAASGVRYAFEIEQTGHGLQLGEVKGPIFVRTRSQ